MNANGAATPVSTSAETAGVHPGRLRVFPALSGLLLTLALHVGTAIGADRAIPPDALGITFARRLPDALRDDSVDVELPSLPPPLPLRRGHVPAHPAVPIRWTGLRLPVRAGLLDRLNVSFLAELNRFEEPVRVRAVVRPSVDAAEAPTTGEQRAWGTPAACEALQGLVSREMLPRYPRWQHPDAQYGISHDEPLRGTLHGADGLLIELVCIGGTLVIDYFHEAGYGEYVRDYDAQVRQWRDNFARDIAELDGELMSLFGIAFSDPIPDLRLEALAAHAHLHDVYMDFEPAAPLPELNWMGIEDAVYRMRVGPDGRLVDVRAEFRLPDEPSTRALFDEFTAMFRVLAGAPSKRSERQWIFRMSDRFITVRLRDERLVTLAGTDAGALHSLIERRERKERAQALARQKRQAERVGGL